MINRALRIIREFHNLTVRELESEIEIPYEMIKRIESGSKPASKEILEKYSRKFDIPLSSLVFISELPRDPKESKNFIRKVKYHITLKALDIMEWSVEKERKKTIKA